MVLGLGGKLRTRGSGGAGWAGRQKRELFDEARQAAGKGREKERDYSSAGLSAAAGAAAAGASSSLGSALASFSCMSEVQRVRLSRRSCIMSVESLYDSSLSVSSSAMASSNACLARWQARSAAKRGEGQARATKKKGKTAGDARELRIS